MHGYNLPMLQRALSAILVLTAACAAPAPLDWSSSRIPKDASVAVFAVDKAGRPWPIVAGLYEAELLRLGLRVVDRSRLDGLIEEQKLGATGLVRAQEAARLGEMAGATHILYCAQAGFNQCALRISKVERGEVVASVPAVGVGLLPIRRALRNAVLGR